MTQLAVADRADLHHSALTLRTTLDAALARRNVLFVLGYLVGGIERLLSTGASAAIDAYGPPEAWE
jgi:hypothetical protein